MFGSLLPYLVVKLCVNSGGAHLADGYAGEYLGSAVDERRLQL